ncbi:MAG: sulfite oxidase [Salinigranum sp.]
MAEENRTDQDDSRANGSDAPADETDGEGPPTGETDDAAEAFERRIGRRYPSLEVVPSGNATLAAGPTERSALEAWITPVEEFFVLNHYPTPDVDGEEWTITLSGAVDRPAALTPSDLRQRYPETSVTHTMVCAGNGRAYFDSREGLPEELVRWRDEAVGNAVWTGVPVGAVLADHGAETTGTWLTAVGGDAPEGENVFARSIPTSKALSDCVLAYEMNGEPLPPEHGRPVRLIVPGWYGVNNVKWLTELRVTEGMIAGPEWERYTRWQQRGYRLTAGVDEDAAERDSIPAFGLGEQFDAGVEHPYTYDAGVMSLIAVADGAAFTPREDGTVELPGVAWAGDDLVERVEVSLDGGETWSDAEFARPPQRGAWRPFRHVTEVPAGEYRVLTRATDDAGRTQPARVAAPGADRDPDADAFPWNPEGYGNNAYRAYGVTITVSDE